MSATSSAVLISVVIPTWNRRELVREVVTSLWQQTLAPEQYEIIVVDNCSTDGTQEMFAELVPRSPCRLVYHRAVENRGAVCSRNAGARLAQAPLLAFTDSDCRVSPDWLETAVAVAARCPDTAVFSGRVRNKPGQEMTFFTVGAVSGEGENPIYPTCNVVYRADVFWKLGGFDEAMSLLHAVSTALESSDADLAWRARTAGFPILFVPEMLVYHEVRKVAPSEWLTMHLRLVFLPELVRRYPPLRPVLVWWGPFCLADNLLFYAACAGITAGLILNPWWYLMALPYLVRMARVVSLGFSARKLFKFPAQLAFLCLRQVFICGALIWGSFRAGRLVL